MNLRVYVEERESNSSDYDGVEEGVLEGIIINIFGAAASSKFIDSENANKWKITCFSVINCLGDNFLICMSLSRMLESSGGGLLIANMPLECGRCCRSEIDDILILIIEIKCFSNINLDHKFWIQIPFRCFKRHCSRKYLSA